MTAGKIDKHALLEALKADLQVELNRSTKRALDAAEGATHEENRAEGDKDMRATEASYIARGQAERVKDLVLSLAKLGVMGIKDFAEDDAIEGSAIVSVAHASKKTTYFLVTAAGGVKLNADGLDLLTLATTSPLGRALLGLSKGDDAEVTTPQGVKIHTIVSVR